MESDLIRENFVSVDTNDKWWLSHAARDDPKYFSSGSITTSLDFVHRAICPSQRQCRIKQAVWTKNQGWTRFSVGKHAGIHKGKLWVHPRRRRAVGSSAVSGCQGTVDAYIGNSTRPPWQLSQAARSCYPLMDLWWWPQDGLRVLISRTMAFYNEHTYREFGFFKTVLLMYLGRFWPDPMCLGWRVWNYRITAYDTMLKPFPRFQEFEIW